MRIFRGLAAAALVLVAFPASADPAAIVMNLTDNFVIPRFRALAEATKAQDDAWTAYCANPAAGDAQQLRVAFNQVGDAWAKIEFFRMGPGAVEMRADRFNFWLDRHDATGHQLTAMLASTDEPAKLISGHIMAQGIPLLERLLYGDDALAQLRGADGARHCEIGKAVTHNLSAIADAIVVDWTAPDGAQVALAANKGWKTSFSDANQAAAVTLTEIVGGIETLKDKKAAYLFHDAANAKAPKLAEASRSARSLRDIELNLASLHEASDIFLAQATPEQKKQMTHAFAEVSEKLTALETLKANASAQRREKATRAALNELDELAESASAILPAATGLSLGFNNLDGD